MGFHAVTRPSTREDLSIEDQLATNVGLILTKSQRQADFFSSGPGYGQTGTGFWNPQMETCRHLKNSTQRSKLVVSHRFLISYIYMRHASLENGDV